MQLKPFNETLICRLIIGRIVGKGETTMDLQLQVCYEMIAAFIAVVGLCASTALVSTLFALLPSQKSVFELGLLRPVANLVGAFWLCWYMLVQLGRMALSMDDTEIGILATLLVGVIISLIFQSDSFIKESNDIFVKVRIVSLICYLLATCLPTYSVWKAQK